MGKLALADDSLWSYCKQYNPSKGYVVGLILGQVSFHVFILNFMKLWTCFGSIYTSLLFFSYFLESKSL